MNNMHKVYNYQTPFYLDKHLMKNPLFKTSYKSDYKCYSSSSYLKNIRKPKLKSYYDNIPYGVDNRLRHTPLYATTHTTHYKTRGLGKYDNIQSKYR